MDIVVDPILKLIGGDFAIKLSGISFSSIIARILLAVIMATIIGFERSSRKQPAGLKTYVLVCLGAVLIMITDQCLRVVYQSGDGSRLSAAVITGVGFLGAGTILFTSRGKVKGLTTAAGIWTVACLGLCLGAGFYTVGIIGFFVIIIVFTCFPLLERNFISRRGCFEIHIELENRAALKDLISFLRGKKVRINQIEYNPAYANSGLSVYSITLLFMRKECDYKNHTELLNDIRNLKYVDFVEEI